MDLKWLREQLERPGFSQRGLAKALGLDPAAVTRLLQGRRKISVDELPIINAYLQIISEEDAKPVVTTLSPLLVWLSTVDGRQGGFMLTNKVIDEIDRAPRFRLAEKAFVVRVIGEENHPVFEVGDDLIINPESPARNGDSCLFTTAANHSRGAESIIARLKGSTAKEWIIEHYPAQGERQIPKSMFPDAWRIVGRYMRGSN